MPQKKNPDVPELIRGKSASVIGSLSSLFLLLKGLPLTYNRDLQEDKSILLNSLETVTACLNLMPRLISTMKVNKDRALALSKQDFSNATDLADYLSMKGVPFRTSHEIVGKIVQYAESKKINLNEISLGEFKKFSRKIGKDVYDAIDIEKSIRSKKATGSTSPSNVKKQAKKILTSMKLYGYA
jgi:argininosuccinate lyase